MIPQIVIVVRGIVRHVHRFYSQPLVEAELRLVVVVDGERDPGYARVLVLLVQRRYVVLVNVVIKHQLTIGEEVDAIRHRFPLSTLVRTAILVTIV